MEIKKITEFFLSHFVKRRIFSSLRNLGNGSTRPGTRRLTGSRASTTRWRSRREGGRAWSSAGPRTSGNPENICSSLLRTSLLIPGPLATLKVNVHHCWSQDIIADPRTSGNPENKSSSLLVPGPLSILKINVHHGWSQDFWQPLK